MPCRDKKLPSFKRFDNGSREQLVGEEGRGKGEGGREKGVGGGGRGAGAGGRGRE